MKFCDVSDSNLGRVFSQVTQNFATPAPKTALIHSRGEVSSSYKPNKCVLSTISGLISGLWIDETTQIISIKPGHLYTAIVCFRRAFLCSYLELGSQNSSDFGRSIDRVTPGPNRHRFSQVTSLLGGAPVIPSFGTISYSCKP